MGDLQEDPYEPTWPGNMYSRRAVRSSFHSWGAPSLQPDLEEGSRAQAEGNQPPKMPQQRSPRAGVMWTWHWTPEWQDQARRDETGGPLGRVGEES